MANYSFTFKDDSLKHHGIEGQKWGVRNGPPYPLGSGDHSPAEKRAMKKEERQTNREERHLKAFKNADDFKKAVAKTDFTNIKTHNETATKAIISYMNTQEAHKLTAQIVNTARQAVEALRRGDRAEHDRLNKIGESNATKQINDALAFLQKELGQGLEDYMLSAMLKDLGFSVNDSNLEYMRTNCGFQANKMVSDSLKRIILITLP